MRRGGPEVEQRLAGIDQLDLPSLRAEWAAVFGAAASARLSRDLLRRAIAYRLQEQEEGGLQPATLRRLRRLAADFRAGEVVKVTSAPTLSPGVRLMREWNGETRIPMACSRRLKTSPKAPSRSRIRWRGALSQGKASEI